MQKRTYFSLGIIVLAIISVIIFNGVYVAAKPTISTIDVHIKDTGATLNGIMENGKKVSQYGFRWGTSRDLDKKVVLTKKADSKTSFSSTLKGLQEGTTYYYQAFAVNPKGTGYGKIKSFTIPAKYNAAPIVTISKPTSNLTVAQGEVVNISATAKDDQQVEAMELRINGTARTGIESDKLNYAWDTSGLNGGQYALKVTAWDGDKTGAQEIKVAVINPESAPTPTTYQTTYQTSYSTPVSRSAATADRSKYPKLSKVNGSFGQFAYRDTSGGRIEVDPNWIANNIVTITLPGLNRQVQVNRAAKDNFIRAFTYIKNGTATINGRQVSLLSLVKTMDGTFVTRHVNWNPARGLSNHSWGTAIDINASNHFRYVDSSEVNDPNLILWEKAFKPAGFSWGNRYSDAMHFEVIR